MSKLYLLVKDTLKPRVSSVNPITRMIPRRNFSAEVQGADKDSSIDQFLNPPQGLVFGRVTGAGISKNILKTDILHYFEGCNLSIGDVKVEYNRAYNPTALMLQFPSQTSYDTALRQARNNGRLYRVEKVDRSHWDLVQSYDGRAILLQGLPRNAMSDDIERLFSGTNFDPNIPPAMRVGPLTLVRFPTRTDAMNAFLTKNKSFCLNNPIIMRVLQ